MKPAHPEHLSDQARREIAGKDWRQIHLTGDRQPALNWWPRRWSYSGAGTRRERGGFSR